MLDSLNFKGIPVYYVNTLDCGKYIIAENRTNETIRKGTCVYWGNKKMSDENYLVIGGEKVELNEETVKNLEETVKKLKEKFVLKKKFEQRHGTWWSVAVDKVDTSFPIIVALHDPFDGARGWHEEIKTPIGHTRTVHRIFAKEQIRRFIEDLEAAEKYLLDSERDD